MVEMKAYRFGTIWG